MKLQILSAGLGTRLKPITEKIPKPVLPILNVPMIFYSYHYFSNEKISGTIVNTFHLEAVLKQKLEKYDCHFNFISDGREILGTGGGISNARKFFEGEKNFWVANGDSVFVSDEDFLYGTKRLHEREDALCTLVVMDHPEVGHKFGGVWVDSAGRVIDIGKNRPKEAVKGYHFTGFRFLSERIFKYLPESGASELFDSLREAIKDGEKIVIYKTSGEFFETGNVADFLSTTETLLKYINEKKYPKFLSSLLKKYARSSSLNDFSFDLKMQKHKDLKNLFIDKSFKLFHDVELEGFIVAGKNVEVRERSSLKNVVILDDQIIQENSHLHNTIIY